MFPFLGLKGLENSVTDHQHSSTDGSLPVTIPSNNPVEVFLPLPDLRAASTVPIEMPVGNNNQGMSRFSIFPQVLFFEIFKNNFFFTNMILNVVSRVLIKF